MNAFQFIDALFVSFFSLIAIWAAVVRRHWFLRFTVLGVFVLAPLLIPAHELVIQTAIQSVLVLTGVWLYRGRPARPRLSLATALLTMVVVAVVATVVARIPELTWQAWTELVTFGVSSSMLALLLLWIAAGRAPWRVRAGLGIAGLVACLVLFHSGQLLTNAISEWPSGKDWKGYVSESYRLDYLFGWTLGQLPRIAFISAICLLAIVLARGTGWFTDDASPSRMPAGRNAVWLALVGLALVVLTPLGYMFYRLLTPQPLPVAQLPAPNGYNDLVAAGRMVPANMTSLGATRALTDAQLEAELRSLQPVFDQIHVGLGRECLMDVRVLASPANDKLEHRTALSAAEQALWHRYAYFFRTGDIDERINSALTILEFVSKAYRCTGLRWFEYSDSHQAPDFVLGELSSMLPQMNAVQCRAVARRVYELGQIRDSLAEQTRVERILDEHRGWRHHARLLLEDWSGYDSYEWLRSVRLDQEADYRTKLVSFAVRAYCLEHHQRPPSLNALCPEYLPAIPADPYGKGPIKMQPNADSVAIYSVGVNGIDDCGVPYRIDAQARIYKEQGDEVLKMSTADLGLE